ncbi:Hypothetical_protein [Hexamita inflata]|uniref:Hypothetical_protein n=1 Tax=Hexamita inflata TaxID=28002 RepID=A0AA86TX45_9EUKA|nr:Hypothetical protein HINF_LOCUS19844 [Hexamita inflata]
MQYEVSCSVSTSVSAKGNNFESDLIFTKMIKLAQTQNISLYQKKVTTIRIRFVPSAAKYRLEISRVYLLIPSQYTDCRSSVPCGQAGGYRVLQLWGNNFGRVGRKRSASDIDERQFYATLI